MRVRDNSGETISEKSTRKHDKDVNIRIKKSTYDMLVEIGKMNESFNDVIRRLVKEYKVLREENERLRELKKTKGS